MRETSPRGWHRWRVSGISSAPPDHMNRLAGPPFTGPDPVAAVSERVEARGPDVIRHELVARIRQQIADGTYDIEAKWAVAEDALLRQIEGRA